MTSPISSNTPIPPAHPDKTTISNPYLFDNLKKLQTLIKQEAMKKEIVIDIKEKVFMQMEEDLMKILENKIKISEKIDKTNQSDKTINYILHPNLNKIYKDETMYISKIMDFLRKYQDYLYKILIGCKTDKEKRCISNLVANFFYINILSSDSIEEEYLFIIYRLLKWEIDSLTQTNAPDKFLNNSICSYLLQYLICNDDIKVYFGKILNEIIDRIDNKEDNHEIKFDPKEIEAKLEEKKDIKDKKLKKNSNEELSENLIKHSVVVDNKNELETEEGYPNSYIDSNSFCLKYIPDLSKKEIQNALANPENDPKINDYIMKQFNEYISTNNDKLFTNNYFVESVYKTKDPQLTLVTYQQDFSLIIEAVSKLIYNLNKNISIIPDSLRFISKIIALLIQRKFPTIINVELNAFIAKFFFKHIMKQIFTETDFNGLLTSKLLTQATKQNIKMIEKIAAQLVSGSFFRSTEFPNFTVFNWYFIEIMPKTIEFFEHLLDVELPPLIQKVFYSEDENICENYIYNYFEEKPDEKLQYTTVCFTPEQIITLYNIMNSNESQFFNVKIDERMKGDFAFFKGSYNKLTDPDHMMFIEKAKQEDDESKRLTFNVLKELHLGKELKIMEEMQGGYFSLKEIETPKNEEERNGNTVIRVKNALSEILYNIHDIPKTNFFGTTILNTTQFVETLLQLMKINYYTLDNPVQTEWYILSLNLLLSKLPQQYQENDYELLYTELSNDVERSINSIDISIFTKIKNKSRYTSKELKQTKNNLENIENVEFHKKIQDFLDNAKININMSFIKISKKKKLIIERNDSEIALKFKYLDNFFYEKKEKGNSIDTIQKFIHHFPNIAKGRNEEELFDLEKSLDIPNALSTYYDIIKKAIKDYLWLKEKGPQDDTPKRKDKTKKEKELELERIKEEEIKKRIEIDSDKIYKAITNYIMSKIYDKLFPKEYDFKDLKIHQQCVMLSWVEPHHIGKIPKILLENFLPSTVNYIQQLDGIKNPYEKMGVFTKVSESILNTLNFCVGKVEGGVDDLLPLLMFVVIKAQPKSFASNMRFIELYYQDLGFGSDSQRFAMMTAIEERLLHFSYLDLMNVSEEEYNKNCELN